MPQKQPKPHSIRYFSFPDFRSILLSVFCSFSAPRRRSDNRLPRNTHGKLFFSAGGAGAATEVVAQSLVNKRCRFARFFLQSQPLEVWLHLSKTLFFKTLARLYAAI